MSQAEDLLNALVVGDSISGESEPHIIIDTDRRVIVPEQLKDIAVQFDHNIETVTFDCPRYWDGHDLFEMHVYINYMCADKSKGTFLCKNIVIDETDENIIHFDWTLSNNVTGSFGTITFLVCAKKTDAEGNILFHWNSRRNLDMNIIAGLECPLEEITQDNPDIIEQMLLKFDEITALSQEQLTASENALMQAQSAVDEASTSAQSAAENASAAETAAQTIDQKIGEWDGNIAGLKGDLANKVDKPTHYEVVTFTEESGYFKDGIITEDTGWKHIEINVSAGETYVIDGVGNGYVHAYNFCKSDKSVISTSTESGLVTFIDETVKIPNECRYLIINYRPGVLASVNIKKKFFDDIDLSCLSESIEELKNTKADYPIRIEPVAFTENTGYYREDGINGNTSWRYAKIPIEKGTYIVDCFGNKYVRGWYLLDTDSNIIAKADETEVSNIYTNETVVATSDGFLVLNRNHTISALKCHRKITLEVGANKLYGKRIACFGDSIFGNAREDGITDIIAMLTGATVYNCAFGGARMSVHLTENWTKCSMFHIADCIASGDYSSIYNAVHDSSWSGMPYYFTTTEALIENIDFSKIDVVTISYGTNDFTGNVAIDNAENKYDTSTLCGALRHSIETLLAAYPNLRIYICLPCYRWWFDSTTLEFTDDSDTHMNTNGNSLVEFCEAIENVAKEYHLVAIDNYNVGINKFNREQYIPRNDGTHHNVKGRKLLAEHIINEVF